MSALLEASADDPGLTTTLDEFLVHLQSAIVEAFKLRLLAASHSGENNERTWTLALSLLGRSASALLDVVLGGPQPPPEALTSAALDRSASSMHTNDPILMTRYIAVCGAMLRSSDALAPALGQHIVTARALQLPSVLQQAAAEVGFDAKVGQDLLEAPSDRLEALVSALHQTTEASTKAPATVDFGMEFVEDKSGDQNMADILAGVSGGFEEEEPAASSGSEAADSSDEDDDLP
eukprot:CAMPEP_0175934868 /NCGR_PEP_ID=MMETSP0108-20121206/20722_1 /TAXON_ID=195067 ORGANISM="Goniomonas pacifica, Strain CCMP1869" /NCGR_SAMPLE_ID=MMETSP0108 /ASSEMBLY_ACC=CAM_ASM_000204 /LENGTH=234 /DNA_ID=CAMNT_0017258741 /DNA_START=21 /DNA_END=722 /DNA_ORIENTATION=-